MVRHYLPVPVDADSIERIAAAASTAPSAGNSRGTAVVVVTDPIQRDRIAVSAGESAYVARGFDPWISSAAALLVVCVSEKVYRTRYDEPDKAGVESWTVPFWWVDGGASLMAILLAAVDEGLGAGFLGGHSIPDLSEILELPPTVTPLGVVTVGHPAQNRRSRSLDQPSDFLRLHRDRWQR